MQVALFTRAWIEIEKNPSKSEKNPRSPSSRGRGLKLFSLGCADERHTSPSSRGRGLKYNVGNIGNGYTSVALFTRAWIEIRCGKFWKCKLCVALFTRAWIEIAISYSDYSAENVALFTRAWIEILPSAT